NLLIADADNNRIRRVTPAGIITTIAGNGLTGSAGDNGLAVDAALSSPSDVAVAGAGDIYIADTNVSRIRRVNPGGFIVTYAGSGNSGFSGDGGLAGAARLSFPSGVAVDSAANLFI